VTAVHLLVFAAGVGALGATGLRWAGSLVIGLAPRILGAAGAAAGLAVAEALLLGLFGEGSSPWWLAAAAVASYVVARLLLAGPRPRVRDQLAERWLRCGPVGHAVVGGVVVLVGGVTAFQLWHPVVGGDGLRYHAAQPVVWLSDGHPGSFHQTIANFPTQAYPKTVELLVAWVYATARTPVAVIPLTVGLTVLTAAAVYVALRKLSVPAGIAGLATAPGLLLPLNMQQSAGIYSDLPALAWLACGTALCVFAVDEPGALGLAAIAEGLAIGTKPSTAPFALVGLGWALWVNRRWVATRLSRLAAPAALAAGLGVVWYVADWVTEGSPLWPFSRFPSGRPVPPVWRLYTSRFLDDPDGVVRAVGGHEFAALLGGGLVVLAAVPVLALLGLLPSSRPERRTVLVGAALVALDVLLWADSQFTGLTGNGFPLILTTIRYVSPAPVAAAALLALAARDGRLLRGFSVTVLVAALALDLWELHHIGFGFPFEPGIAGCLALAAVGAVAGVFVGRARRSATGLRTPGLAIVVVLVAGVLMALPAARFLPHYQTVAQRYRYGDAQILSFLSQQPGWTHGDAPVAAGYTAYSTLAGPHFDHPLSFIPDDEPCVSIRAAAQRGWVVLEPLADEPSPSLDYLRAPACMAGVTPAATLGQVKIYAPQRLLAAGGSGG
jgi:hypothetical protein